MTAHVDTLGVVRAVKPDGRLKMDQPVAWNMIEGEIVPSSWLAQVKKYQEPSIHQTLPHCRAMQELQNVPQDNMEVLDPK